MINDLAVTASCLLHLGLVSRQEALNPCQNNPRALLVIPRILDPFEVYPDPDPSFKKF